MEYLWPAGFLLSAAAPHAGSALSARVRIRPIAARFWLKGAAGLCFLAMGLLAAEKVRESDFAWRVSGAVPSAWGMSFWR